MPFRQSPRQQLSHISGHLSEQNEPQIGDMHEGVVEGGKDTGNAENELACEL